MKYRTTIEVTSEANNRDEAMEIVGEYLSGNIVSGVDMKCHTKAVRPYNKVIVSVLVMVLMVTVGVVSFISLKPSQNIQSGIAGMDAVQAPLRTAPVEIKTGEFKKEWQDQHNKEALSFLKK